MQAFKKINNNTVLCTDTAGHTVIAMGRGLGFGALPRELSLSEIERTFYDVSSQYLAVLPELDPELVEFSAQIIDIAAGELPYQLSPNAAFTLSDHISFAIKRAKTGITVRMPLEYDVEQLYPQEYRLGNYALKRIQKLFKIGLAQQEAVGIALNLLNSRIDVHQQELNEEERDREMLEDVTEIVEQTFRMMIDRSSFNYSRYATHLQYLFARIHSGEAVSSDNLQIYEPLKNEFPLIAECVEKISDHIEEKWNCELSSEEKLYLILHVNRICTKN